MIACFVFILTASFKSKWGIIVNSFVISMGNEGKGTLFRRKDDRYLLYLPVRVVDDSMFPLKCDGSMPVKVKFNPADGKLIVEKWREE
ncbi:MAG: hypothetical protein M1540_03020 [Candidatus Bathyarchaeota archaeon]|nr:hypothetical protein [Candidatus Bathyarchaeota archaeon]